MATIAARQESSPDKRRSETQGYLVIDSAPDQSFVGQRLISAGALSTAGTYVCHIDTHDWSALEAILKPSAVTGTVTPYLDRMYHNRREIRDTVSGIAFVVATRQVLSTTTVIGTQRFQVRIVVAGGASVTFDPGSDPTAQTALAEFNGA